MNLNTTPQPNTRRGEIEVEIGGRQRRLRFDMNALIAFGQLHSDGPTDFSLIFLSNPLLGLRDMAYCALLMRRDQNELPDDFSREVVGDWIWEMDPDDWARVQAVMSASLTPGKTQPDPTATEPATSEPTPLPGTTSKTSPSASSD